MFRVLGKTTNVVLGASLLAPIPPQSLYDVLLDVRNVPTWAPGVQGVEVLEGYGEAGMVSEWEICLLGMKRKFLSVLEEAEPPALLRWIYEGLVGGWGQCVIREQGESTLAVFQTELWATEPHLKRLIRMGIAREAASTHLKRCLAQLGRIVSKDGSRVLVGPAFSSDAALLMARYPRAPGGPDPIRGYAA